MPTRHLCQARAQLFLVRALAWVAAAAPAMRRLAWADGSCGACRKVLYFVVLLCGAASYGGTMADSPGFKLEAVRPTADEGVGTTGLIEFEGRSYPFESGMAKLVQAATDTRRSIGERRAALRILGPLSPHLYARGELPAVLARAMEETDAPCRIELLRCAVQAVDPRALPVFKRTLQSAEDPDTRQVAAGGLARWNERSGVQELIALLEVSADAEPEALARAEKALIALNEFNAVNGWGCDLAFLYDDFQRMGGGGEIEKARLAKEHWAKWFNANQHRFPVLTGNASDDAAP